MKTYIVVPTFREAQQLKGFLGCMKSQLYATMVIVVINGGNYVETSETIKLFSADLDILEIVGSPDKYWSGLTNLGLRHVLSICGAEDYVIIANVDIFLSATAVRDIIRVALEHGRAQVGPVVVYKGKVQSSAVTVRSWAFCQNSHPFIGMAENALPLGDMVDVDFLPTRFVAVPVSAIRAFGLVRECYLPHYAADYEFTHRMKKKGCPTYLFTGMRVECDMDHTGNSVYRKRIPFGRRLAGVLSIKSEYNPIYRTIFIILTYPWYAIVPAGVLYLGKSVLEVLFGGLALKRLGVSQQEQ